MTEKKAFVVIGLGYGDEGKGLATDYLCRHADRPIVIRFNGGHQAGHTVVTREGQRHVFSCLGSGTLRGVPTYWSRFCTFSPTYLLTELVNLIVKPCLLVDKLSPVVTHYDVLYNRAIEATRGMNRLGSCGLGFGATIERHFENKLQLTVEDLTKQSVFTNKLTLIRAYYKLKMERDTQFKFVEFDHDTQDKQALIYNQQTLALQDSGILQLVNEPDVFQSKEWNSYIFEGAQGIMLDQIFGKVPYITKSNTSSQNAMLLLNENDLEDIKTEIVYTTRAYSTRHGSGPFPVYDPPLILKNNDMESNVYNQYQGEFKIGRLSIDQLNAALAYDHQFSYRCSRRLIITCLDQLDHKQIPVIMNDKLNDIHFKSISKYLIYPVSQVHYSFSSCSDDLC